MSGRRDHLPLPHPSCRGAPGVEALASAAGGCALTGTVRMPEQEKRIVLLAPSQWHAMPAGEIVKTSLIIQHNGLLDRPAQAVKFPGAECLHILSDLKAGGRSIRVLAVQ
jgi:hypothetical protein